MDTKKIIRKRKNIKLTNYLTIIIEKQTELSKLKEELQNKLDSIKELEETISKLNSQLE